VNCGLILNVIGKFAMFIFGFGVGVAFWNWISKKRGWYK